MKPYDLVDAPYRSIGRASGTVVAVLLCLAAWLAFSHAQYVELSFDGAMNMQVPRNRIAYGRYATSYHEFVDFSPAVQTGVTVLYPAELAVRALGTTTLAAQLPNVVYLVLALLIATMALRGLIPSRLTPVAILLLLCTPELLDYGMRGYGEVPGLFFVLAGIAAIAPRADAERVTTIQASITGLAFGLAYLTKTVMLIVVPALVVALLYDLFVSRRMTWRALTIMLIMAVTPVIAYEAWKFSVLGTEGYCAWWDNQSGSIMVQAGVSSGMLDTPGFWAKLGAHLDILGAITRLSRLELALFLIAPYAALTLCVAIPALRSRFAVPTHLVILTGTALAYVCWWLFMTPTSRAWARRIMPGLMLHELVTLIALVAAARQLMHRFSSRGQATSRQASPVLLSSVTIILAATLTHYAIAGAARIALPRPGKSGMTSAAAIGAHVRQLEPDAHVYARRWWQAPAVAYYSDRMFYDIDRVPQQRFNEHDKNYFVVDDTMRKYGPDKIEAILQRSDHTLIADDGLHALYRIHHLYRFPQFTEQELAADLPAMIDLREGAYQHVRALQQDANGFFWSRGVTVILLQHSGQTHLHLVLWFPPLSGYDGTDLAITTIVDNRRLDPVHILRDGILDTRIPLPAHFNEPRGPVAVELHFNKPGYRPDPAKGIQPSLYVILVAGFAGSES